jgi:hypothetical protein
MHLKRDMSGKNMPHFALMGDTKLDAHTRYVLLCCFLGLTWSKRGLTILQDVILLLREGEIEKHHFRSQARVRRNISGQPPFFYLHISDTQALEDLGG